MSPLVFASLLFARASAAVIVSGDHSVPTKPPLGGVGWLVDYENYSRAGKRLRVHFLQRLPDAGSPDQCRHHRKRHEPLVEHGCRRRGQEDAAGRDKRLHAVPKGGDKVCGLRLSYFEVYAQLLWISMDVLRENPMAPACVYPFQACNRSKSIGSRSTTTIKQESQIHTLKVRGT